MLEGINYLHAKFKTNILKKQKKSYQTFKTLATQKKKQEIANTRVLLYKTKNIVTDTWAI